MTKIDSGSTIKRLKSIFARFGLPLSITADNGPQFTSQEFDDYCKTNNIILRHTTPFWPQQNGEVERQNRSILKRLTISQNMGKNWRDDLQDYLLMYRSTPHTVTLKSPAQLMFNRHIRDKLPTMDLPIGKDEEVADRDKEQKEKMKELVDRKRRAQSINIQKGDLVILKRQQISNKLQSLYNPTIYKVIHRMGSEIVVESQETSARYRRNVAHAKLIAPDNIPTNQQSDNNLIPSPELPTSHSLARSPVISNETSNSSTHGEEGSTVTKRSRRAPARFKDYVK